MSTLLRNPFRWSFGLLVVASACGLTVATVWPASFPDVKTRPGDPGDSSAVTLQMIPLKDTTPEVARSVEKEFPNSDVHALQMLDDQVVLAFVETFPGKWSGLYLADVKTHKKSDDAIAPIGEVIGTAKDSGGSIWTIIEGESEARGYIEHNYSAVRIRRIGDHSYESSLIWLASYASEFESEENLCLYFKAGESVDLDAILLTDLKKNASSASIIEFRQVTMRCPSREKAKKIARFVPSKNGFDDSAHPQKSHTPVPTVFP